MSSQQAKSAKSRGKQTKEIVSAAASEAAASLRDTFGRKMSQISVCDPCTAHSVEALRISFLAPYAMAKQLAANNKLRLLCKRLEQRLKASPQDIQIEDEWIMDFKELEELEELKDMIEESCEAHAVLGDDVRDLDAEWDMCDEPLSLWPNLESGPSSSKRSEHGLRLMSDDVFHVPEDTGNRLTQLDDNPAESEDILSSIAGSRNFDDPYMNPETNMELIELEIVWRRFSPLSETPSPVSLDAETTKALSEDSWLK